MALADIYGNVLFYIPSAFTPDNDGLNDAFEITGRQIRLFEIWIYNRWGELVYHSTDLDDVWTGDVNGGTHFAPNGVYQWVIKATGFDTNAEEFRWICAPDALIATHLFTETPFFHDSIDREEIHAWRLCGRHLSLFMWGFITVLVDALIPRLKEVFELTFAGWFGPICMVCGLRLAVHSWRKPHF